MERLLEKYPAYQGVFTFVQIGAPSRTHIKRYHDLQAEIEAEADRINWRFQSDRWKPIVLLNRQHSHKEIAPYYRAADLCLVTALHDGMNLVEGIHRHPTGRTRRAHSELLHWRRPRTARCVTGQSLRHRPDGGGDSRGARNAAGRKADAHAAHAKTGA